MENWYSGGMQDGRSAWQEMDIMPTTGWLTEVAEKNSLHEWKENIIVQLSALYKWNLPSQFPITHMQSGIVASFLLQA